MQEYLTEAVVLDREPSGDLDFRVSLFTKKFGKMVAKVKSARKITSKLSGHLIPGNIVNARIIEKNGLQVVDAVKKSAISCGSDFYFLNKVLADAEPDLAIWQKITSNNFQWLEILKTLGWDPEFASCSSCSRSNPKSFNFRSQEFLCANCFLNFGKKELLYINI